MAELLKRYLFVQVVDDHDGLLSVEAEALNAPTHFICTTVQSVLEGVNRYSSVNNSLWQFVPVRDNSLTKEVSPQSMLLLL